MPSMWPTVAVLQDHELLADLENQPLNQRHGAVLVAMKSDGAMESGDSGLRVPVNGVGKPNHAELGTEEAGKQSKRGTHVVNISAQQSFRKRNEVGRVHGGDAIDDKALQVFEVREELIPPLRQYKWPLCIHNKCFVCVQSESDTCADETDYGALQEDSVREDEIPGSFMQGHRQSVVAYCERSRG